MNFALHPHYTLGGFGRFLSNEPNFYLQEMDKIGYNSTNESNGKSVLLAMHVEKKGPWLDMRVTRKQIGRTVQSVLQTDANLSTAVVQELLQSGNVLLGEQPARAEDVISSGDRLRCVMFPEEAYGVEPAMLPLDVLYEDDHLIVVNKPVGMKVHGNDAEETDTLLNALAFHYQMHGEQQRVRQLHRLDQDTSGAILFPKHPIAQKLLDSMLAERTISREYWAVVTGRVKQPKGLIDAPIGRDRYHATRRRVSKTGKAAQTDYEVVSRLQGATLVKAKLRTGRTHQIRVHFADLGHPLLGDELYGGSRELFDRQALHAKFLRFVHPITTEHLEIEAPLPDDLADLLDRLQLS